MLYITSLCSAKKRIVDSVKELIDLGFRNIELTGGTRFYAEVEEGLLDLKKTYQLNFLIHNYFPPQPEDFVLNLASSDLNLRNKARDLIKKAVVLSKKFGNNLYTLHPGFMNNLLPTLESGFFIKENKRVTSREDFYRALDFILGDIVGSDFKIAVENLCPKSFNDRYSFISSLEDIEQFLGYYADRANVGVLLDLGHLNIASQLIGFDKNKVLADMISRFKERIFEIHLSENNGKADFHNISSIDSWQIEFLSKNKEFIKSIPVVLEWQGCAGPLAYERFKIIQDRLG